MLIPRFSPMLRRSLRRSTAIMLVVSPVLTACRDTAPPPASAVAELKVVQPPQAVSLTLQSGGSAQQGGATPNGEVRLQTARRTDDDATARLCGVLVGRSRFSEAIPFTWPVDSLLPQLAPKIITGPDVYGLRVLIPGKDAAYRFEGFTVDGGTRVSLRWPVRSGSSVPATASDPEIEAVIEPSPLILDSLVMALRYADTAPTTPWVTSAPADAAPNASRAVRLVRDVPFYPIGFTPACRDAHFSITVGAGIDKVIRVLTQKNERIAATVSSPTGDIVVSVGTDANATAPARTASATAAADGYATVRIRYTTMASSDPIQQTVLLRVTSELR